MTRTPSEFHLTTIRGPTEGRAHGADLAQGDRRSGDAINMTLLSHNAALLVWFYLENRRLRLGGFFLVRSMSQWQSNELFQLEN